MTRKRNHIPTDKNHHMVEAMAAVGTPSEDMATMLGISKDTLERHYMDTIKAGRVKANLQIGRKIHAQALEGDTALLIWWTKTRMRWAAAKEPEEVQNPADVGNITVVIERGNHRKKPTE